MAKIFSSIRKTPINLILIIAVLLLYFLNNMFLKWHTTGIVQEFFICYFNDLMCPIFFLSYSNLLLLGINMELKKLHWILLYGFCAGLIWEFVGPLIKVSSVTDFFDLVCYLLGSIFYWGITRLAFLCRGRISYD